MQSMERIKTGLHLAKESFVVLWRHKILIAYPILASLLFGAIQYSASALYKNYEIRTPDNVKMITNGTTMSYGISPDFMTNLLERSHYSIIFLLFFMYALITIFFAYVLIHHLFALLSRQATRLSTQLAHGLKRLTPLAAWALISAIGSFVTLLIPLTYSIQQKQTVGGALETTLVNTFRPVNIIVQLIILVWIFVTMLVIPLLAAHDYTLLSAIRNSARTVKNMFVEIVSGYAVYLALATTLGIAGYFLSGYFLWQIMTIVQNPFLFVASMLIMLIAGGISSAALTTFPALIVWQDRRS